MNEEQSAESLRYINGEQSEAERLLFEKSMNASPELRAEMEKLRELWQDLGLLPVTDPTPALRAQFYQKLNAAVRETAPPDNPWWKHTWVPQMAAAAAIFLMGIGIGRVNRSTTLSSPPADVAQLRTQVESLRQTVALSLMEQPSASSRLEGISRGSQVDQPDQDLLTALLTTLNHDQNINVRLASLEALERFTSNAAVRQQLERSIPSQQSPLLQIALIDALVHIHDNAAANEFKQLSGDAAVNATVRERAQWGLKKLSFE